VVGATGGLGQKVVVESLTRGHEITALARDPSGAALPEAVQVVKGDVLDRASLKSVLVGRDAVICGLGRPARGGRAAAAGRHSEPCRGDDRGVRRLVCVTLLGLGSSRANRSVFYREVILRVLAPMVADEQAQEQWCAAAILIGC
jgi:putative NADH-flavin reductase